MTDRILRRASAGLLLLLAAAGVAAQMIGWGGAFPRLAEEDIQRMQQAARGGLDGMEEGGVARWENPATRAKGQVELLRRFQRQGRPCRLVLHTFTLPGQETWVFRSTLCRDPHGEWKVLERERPHPAVPELRD
jgi:surface antigen